MRNSRVAHRYAKALMDLAVETNQVEAVMQDIAAIQAVTNAELRQVLLSPIIKHDKKVSIFKAIFEGKISSLTQSFFNLVFTKGRETSLTEINEAFHALYRKMKGIAVLELTTAVPISEEMKENIRKGLESRPRFQGKTLEVREKVDPDILGGFVLQVEDILYDASIRHDLQVIKQQFVENMYVQKIR
ncbi:ATP synthase F1 subunit delta [Flavihumibacter rivuli]|uniref:ATP synthase F1 subunit delta n=1 Tax=Flavihumibacter rivuli TaxID=2838156 RepID=UPI001BDE15E9|nr:ATP synthase F1 subunit delta [Flavihumibacter rivuli]ULQ56365.1 ATP synthase F1 subunit delta [Flavihumibacter rivuli]